MIIRKLEKKRTYPTECNQTLLLLCADLPQASAGLRAADGEGGGHDLRQLEGAHYVQHQTAQVTTEELECKMNFYQKLKQTRLKKCVSLTPPAGL